MNSTLNNNNLRTQCSVRERSCQPIVKVNRLAYMRYGRMDLDKAIEFFQDFGLLLDAKEKQFAYLRCIEQASHAVILEDSRQEYSVMGFTVNSLQELELLANAKEVEIKQRDCPLGGCYIELHDPDGNLVEINFALNELCKFPHYKAQVEANTPTDKPRLNDVVRPALAPPPIARLGHTVLGVNKIEDSLHWYQDTLGFIVSDFQLLKGHALPAVSFLRCDQGETPSDHHTLALGSAVGIGHEHTAFEVADIDLIAMGQQWLKAKGHHHSWGIGRHNLGSQIFDYWRDPWGFQFEHYCDGDVFDDEVVTAYCDFSSRSLAQWGPEVTKDMLGIKPGFGLVEKVSKQLWANNDLTFKRLISLIKAT